MFNDWLLNQMQQKEWSQADLARHSGLTKGAISKYMMGRIPDDEAIRKIAHALNLPADLIFEQANKLPHKPELSNIKRKLLHIAKDLPDSDVEIAITLLEQRQEYYKKHPQAKPAK
ncbi:MAG: helix-turn-helix domain-containing protein [Anaerolineaceae bacterium]|nr:MAG: helix-turn-helix domain-containing protein [Anaerolineaceae bacterium]